MKKRTFIAAAALLTAITSSAFAAQHSSMVSASPKSNADRSASVCECGARLDGSKQHSHQLSVGMQVKGLKVSQSERNAIADTANAFAGKAAESASNGGSSFPKVGFIH